jgi:E3 ubiquitin-protein ligase BIG BROTHER-like protein
MASYLDNHDERSTERSLSKSPAHEGTPSRTLAFDGVEASPQGPPLSPYRDPSQNASEMPTPVRTPAPASASGGNEAGAGDADAESLRLCMELQAEEERYHASQRDGEERLARLEAARAEAGDDAEEEDGDDDDEPRSGDEDDEEDDEEIDESLALAWRLQQEDDDRALLMAMNGGTEPPAGVTARNLSPSQMTYDQLMELGDNIGKVSKGAAATALDKLPTCAYGCAAEHNAIVGEQCAICRMEFEDDDVMRILPCRHAEHAECVDQWLLINRCCPLCQKDVAPRADAADAAAGAEDENGAPAAADGETNFTAADTDDIDDLLGL